MGLFTGTGLDPANDPTTDVWASTRAEIVARGFEIHGSLTKRNISDGATAVVLKATEAKSGRIVAIKVYKEPNRQVSHRNGDTIPMTNFFENERRMLAGLQACSLVPKYYFSVASDDATSGDAIQPFHVMEFIEGERITKYAKESVGKNKLAMIGLFRQVLDAISTVHRFGYLHRDLSDGNVLVDRTGNIRLIDFAEASPLGEDHTRLITTPGFGTEGVATAAQEKVRKIQTDDVRDACTIGYAMFTGRWRQGEETLADWRRNLNKSGTPVGVAAIIVKGMQPRDTNRKYDNRVWNSANEVIEAIDRLEANRRFRKSLIRNSIGLTAIAVVMLVFGYIAWERIQQFAYTSELRRLSEQRQVLSEIPRNEREDPRVQQRLEAALELEQQADTANRQGNTAQASALLAQAVDKIAEASRLADNLTRLRPLLEPLRKILVDNKQWNRDCPDINSRLTELGKEHEAIQRHVDQDDPDEAWSLLASLQPKLVQLIDDNQKSYEITDLMQQLNSQSIGLSAELQKLSGYEQIKGDSSRAAQYYADGKWREARTELLGAMTSLKSFLAKHETEEQRKTRLASNTELVNTQLATSEALQKEVADLSKQVADAKANYQEVLFQGAQYQKERDAATSKLDGLQTQLKSAKATLDEKLNELTAATTERDSLAKWKQEKEPLIADYVQRLERGTKAWMEQKVEFEQTQKLLAELSEKPSIDPDAAKRALALADAERAIKQFVPDSWEAANERLAKESTKYESLLVERKRLIDGGRTDRHVEVREKDEQLASQFRIVVTALKKRDAEDQKAWQAIESQITYQRTLRQTTVDEGWAESSPKIRDIDTKVRVLLGQQKAHESGRQRLDGGKYNFADWAALKNVPEVKFAASLAAFGELKQGKKFTNSIGMELVYLPPGEFMMGSPTNEAGRDSDETQHKVILTQGFFVATTEATQAAYRRVTGEEPWKGKDYVREGDNFPAVYTSWDDVTEKFLTRLNAMERKNGTLPDGWEYRLLTEAEWEYAARAGSPNRFCFGDDESQLGQYAWFDDNAWDIDEQFAHEVATKRPNKWGLYDFHGNCWEWTADSYADYASGVSTNPLVNNGGTYRVRRGGSFSIALSSCRSADRSWYSPDGRYGILGFRVACVQLPSKN